MTAYRSISRNILAGGSAALALLLAACSGAPSSEEPSGPPAASDDAPTDGPDPAPGDDPGDDESGEDPGNGDPGEDPGNEDPGEGPAASGTEPPPTGEEPPDDSEATTDAPQAAELPRGGTEIFPDFRLFGYAGLPGSPGMGRMGIGDLDERVEEMEERGAEYAGGRDLLPVLELIATVVHASPGSDGMYRSYTPESVIQDHLEAARRHDGILLLNIQPGRSDFIDEVEHYETWLQEPDVGVALDPEWAVDEGQIPGQVYGSTTGAELDEVAEYLADLVEEHALPEKVMVYHQVHAGVVRDEDELQAHDGVVQIKSVDGIGAPSDKIGTYDRVMDGTPEHVVPGFKLFYEEDAELGPIMTGAEVLGLEPQPEYVLFE